jgi:hypothetical protein
MIGYLRKEPGIFEAKGFRKGAQFAGDRINDR